MKTKRINIGKLLSEEIEKQGLKKNRIADALSISRPTLNTRLIDGEFTEEQIRILKEKRFIDHDL